MVYLLLATPYNRVMKKSRARFIFMFISAIIIGVLVVVYINLPQSKANIPYITFVFGVLTSVVASLLYSVISDLCFYTKQDEQIEESLRCISLYETIADKLDNTTDVMTNMTTKGITNLCLRNEIPYKYWNSFVKNAKDYLILSGKTLHRWIENPEEAEIFSGNLLNILEQGCKVTFVIYKRDSLIGDDIEERDQLKTFLYSKVFPKIFSKDRSPKGSLNIKETDRLPYFYITNGIESITMPYFANESNDKNLALIMKANNEINGTYYSDYSKIINKAQCNSWIEEFKNT